jgi:hypothetical protein
MNWHWETRHLTWSCEAIEGVKTRGGLEPFFCGYLAAGDGQRELAVEILVITPSIPNYKTFNFFDTKFDHSSYLNFFFAKYHFFYRGLLY